MSQPRILIVKLSSLGDILHVAPTAQALHDQLGATIDWATQPEYESLVGCFECVERVITVERHRRIKSGSATYSALNSNPYDMVIDLHGLFKSARVVRAVKSPRKIGPSFARELSWLAYHERAGKMNRHRHAVDQTMDVLDHLQLQRPADAALRLRFPPVALTPARLKIAIAPATRWRTKNWPPAYFGELAKMLSHLADVRLFIVGTQADSEVGELIRQYAPEAVENLCGRHTIPQLFGALDNCDLLITNDTGPMHVAAALGKATLALFGPTKPELTGPYGDGHRCLLPQAPCAACALGLQRRGRHTCLASIKPRLVYEAALEIIERVEQEPKQNNGERSSGE